MEHTKIVQLLMQLVIDLRHHHWNTKSYSAHMALGSAYDDLSSKVDVVAETLVGGEGNIMNMTFKSPSTTFAALPAAIVSAGEMLDEYAEEKYPDLCNTSDEIVAIGNKLKYLYRLA
jgi:DNA-binding ferritin-like protein